MEYQPTKEQGDLDILTFNNWAQGKTSKERDQFLEYCGLRLLQDLKEQHQDLETHPTLGEDFATLLHQHTHKARTEESVKQATVDFIQKLPATTRVSALQWLDSKDFPQTARKSHLYYRLARTEVFEIEDLFDPKDLSVESEEILEESPSIVIEEEERSTRYRTPSPALSARQPATPEPDTSFLET